MSSIRGKFGSLAKNFEIFASGKYGARPPGAIVCINGGIAKSGAYVLYEYVPKNMAPMSTKTEMMIAGLRNISLNVTFLTKKNARARSDIPPTNHEST